MENIIDESQIKNESVIIPEEFKKVIKDFISDIKITFPEYELIINKWWKCKKYSEIVDEEFKQKLIVIEEEENLQYIFKYCLKIYPERFFDILYQNIDLFSVDSTINTEFLPGLSFKYLWNCDITDKTRETIWNYLQLILISLIKSIQNKEAFGNSAKLFDSINECDFKEKLEEALEKMQHIFEKNKEEEETESHNNINLNSNTNNTEKSTSSSVNDIHEHITGMLGGKLGNLAKEIADETANSFDFDMDNIKNSSDIFKTIFSNPGKLMDLVKTVGSKLDSSLKSGDLNESELFSEATNMMKQMKDIPGLDNIQDMLKQMGLPGANNGLPGANKNTKLDLNAMNNQLAKTLKAEKTKNRFKEKLEEKYMKNLMEQAATELLKEQKESQKPMCTDEQLHTLFNEDSKSKKNKKNKIN